MKSTAKKLTNRERAIRAALRWRGFVPGWLIRETHYRTKSGADPWLAAYFALGYLAARRTVTARKRDDAKRKK